MTTTMTNETKADLAEARHRERLAETLRQKLPTLALKKNMKDATVLRKLQALPDSDWPIIYGLAQSQHRWAKLAEKEVDRRLPKMPLEEVMLRIDRSGVWIIDGDGDCDRDIVLGVDDLEALDPLDKESFRPCCSCWTDWLAIDEAEEECEAVEWAVDFMVAANCDPDFYYHAEVLVPACWLGETPEDRERQKIRAEIDYHYRQFGDGYGRFHREMIDELNAKLANVGCTDDDEEDDDDDDE